MINDLEEYDLMTNFVDAFGASEDPREIEKLLKEFFVDYKLEEKGGAEYGRETDSKNRTA